MSVRDEVDAAVMAALLAQARGLDLLSIGLTIAAAALLLAGIGPWGPKAVVVACGLLERYLAVRVGFDAELFRIAASSALTPGDLDDTLSRMGLVPRQTAARPWIDRCAGARRLLGFQAAAVVLQCTAAIAAALPGLR